jgi:hypothetical protein
MITPIAEIEFSIYLNPIDTIDEDFADEEELLAILPRPDLIDGLYELCVDNLDNIQNIEQRTKALFIAALDRFKVAFEEIYLKKISIFIDYYQNLDEDEPVKFELVRTNPAKGEYAFNLNQKVLKRYLSDYPKEKAANWESNFWEVAIVQILDFKAHLTVLELKHSDVPQNNLIYYMLKFRSAGIANLIPFLDRAYKEYESFEVALNEFSNDCIVVQNMLLAFRYTDEETRNKVYQWSYFEHLGPWLVLYAFRNLLCALDEITFEEFEEKIILGKYDDQSKFELLAIFLLQLDNNEFLAALDGILEN